MLLLKVLSGSQAGTEKVARRFPFRVGRQAGAQLQLEDPGVWEDHFSVEFQPREGFILVARAEAITTLNGEAVQQRVTVRNGDIIGAGSAQVRAWLSPARQRSGMFREALIWAAVIGVTLSQIVLIYLLT